MCKCLGFPITQKLREIKFWILEVLKIAVFAILVALKALDFVDLVNFIFQKVQKFIKNQNSETVSDTHRVTVFYFDFREKSDCKAMAA